MGVGVMLTGLVKGDSDSHGKYRDYTGGHYST